MTETFLPHPNFDVSVGVLDDVRLQKQRIDAWNVYEALTDYNHPLVRHPVTTMWLGYNKSLLLYGMAACREWKSRGYNDLLHSMFKKELIYYTGSNEMPEWFGDERFHSSQKSKLILGGRMDAAIDVIQRAYNTTRINDWLEKHGLGTKNTLKYLDILKLEAMAIQVSNAKNIIYRSNFYNKYKWSENGRQKYNWVEA